MQINRQELLAQLTAVSPGLASAKEVQEQATCYIFADGHVITYNGEIACRIPCPLLITGALTSGPLVKLLEKLPEDVLEVEVKDNGLAVKGKGRQAMFTLIAEVLLPIEEVEAPEKWRKLPDGFLEAVAAVQQCAGEDDSEFQLTCVHITPGWLEACDNYQYMRQTFPTGFKQNLLLRQSALKHIVGLGVTRVSETQGWVHFRAPSGLVISCRRYLEAYPATDALLDVAGEEVTLPPGLSEAAEKAAVFTAENVENNHVMVELTQDRIAVRGEGTAGWFREVKRAKYTGPRMMFMVRPKLLQELVERTKTCLVGNASTALPNQSPGRLKVTGPGFAYIALLGLPGTPAEVPAEAAGEDEAPPKKRRQKAAVVAEE